MIYRYLQRQQPLLSHLKKANKQNEGKKNIEDDLLTTL